MVSNTPDNLYSKMNKMAQVHRSEIAMELQKNLNIDDAHSRVLVSIPSAFHNRLTDENLSVCVASKIPDVRYMPGSLHRASLRDKTLFGIFVAKNRKTISMEQASAAGSGFTKVSDTVFQDSNDAIWTVVQNGDTAFLVQQAEEDINSLLGAVRTRAIATASVEVAMSEDYGAGMPILFYDLDKEEMAFAIAVDGASAYVPDQDIVKEVLPETVVNVNDAVALPVEKEKETAGITAADKASITEFMRLLYGQNKDFLAEINAIIRQTVSI